MFVTNPAVDVTFAWILNAGRSSMIFSMRCQLFFRIAILMLGIIVFLLFWAIQTSNLIIKMKSKKPMGPQYDPKQESNDVLETAEMLRSASCLLRCTVGIIAFSGNMCKAEVFNEDEIKSINSAYDKLFPAFNKLYASLMGRYSALTSDGVGSSPSNVPIN